MNYFAHPTAVIDEDCEIGNDVKIWHFSHIMSHCKIGNNCNIGQNCVVLPGVVLGKNVRVQNNVSVYTGVTCEDDVFLGTSCVFANVLNPRAAFNRKSEHKKTYIAKGATIGSNSTILGGINIGMYAFIGAGAVVLKSVPDYALVVGNPAKQIGWMSEYGYRLKFVNGIAKCPQSGQVYKLKDGLVREIESK